MLPSFIRQSRGILKPLKNGVACPLLVNLGLDAGHFFQSSETIIEFLCIFSFSFCLLR